MWLYSQTTGKCYYLCIILRNKHFNTTNCRKRVINFQRYFSEIVILEHICKVVVKYNVLIFSVLTHDSESIIWHSVRTIQNHETQKPQNLSQTTNITSAHPARIKPSNLKNLKTRTKMSSSQRVLHGTKKIKRFKLFF